MVREIAVGSGNWKSPVNLLFISRFDISLYRTRLAFTAIFMYST